MIVCMIYCRILTNNSQRSLYSNDELTPEDLFGVLGIFPSFCESKVGGTFKKCQTPAPVSVPQMMMGKGKGGARRKVAVSARDDKLNENVVDALNALSSDDKKRLLVAIEHDDVNMVDSILEYDNQNGKRALQRNVGIDNEPSPEELFGVLGIFPSFCESRVGSTFKKCQTPAPVSVPQMMMGKGKGGARRNVAVSARDNELNEDIVDAFNALSSDDKKRLLVAIEHDDVNMVDAILENENQNGDRALQMNGGIDNEPTPEELFGVLGIFPSFCEGKIGKKLVKCLTKPPTPAPVGKGKMESMMGKRTRRVRDVFEDDVADELLQLYNTMTLHDKKRLLVAIDKDDEELMDELLTQYHHRFG